MSSSPLGELISCGFGATLAALLLEPPSDMALMTAAALLLTHLLRVPGDNPGRRVLLQALHDADGCSLMCTWIERLSTSCKYRQHLLKDVRMSAQLGAMPPGGGNLQAAIGSLNCDRTAEESCSQPCCAGTQ